MTFITFSQPLIAQSTFSLRPNTGRVNAVYNAIVETEGAFVISGIAVDTSYSNYTGSEIILIDHNGNIIDTSFLIETDKHIEAWGDEAFLYENYYYYTGYTRENGHTKILIGRYDLESGEHVYNDLGHPGFPDQFVVSGMALLKTDDRFFAFGRHHQTEPNSNYGSDGFILEFDSSLNILDTTIIKIPVPFGGPMSSMIRTNESYLANLFYGERITRCRPYTGFKLVKLNENFGVESSYQSSVDEHWGIMSNLYQSENGDIYLHANKVYPSDFIYGPGPDDCITDLWTAPAIRKFNSDLEPIWEVDFHRSVDYASVTNLTNIYPATDGDGMVTAYDMSTEGDSTTIEHLTHLVKFDTSGNLIWRRLFYHYDSLNSWNAVRDLKPTSDGGYIMVGEMRYSGDIDSLYPEEAPGQQGWIIKVDQFGCLIPGCEGPLGTEDQVEADEISPIILYPNPSTDLLNFMIPEELELESSRISIRILDIDGKIVFQMPDRRHFPRTTYSLSVRDLPRGQYVLHLRLNGRQATSSFFKS